ncbi:MAG TPA: hypothetical protein VHF22_05025 [Planctomycetota bacterium]|nr:hypothetical protein [Planctomycetota bacterium]
MEVLMFRPMKTDDRRDETGSLEEFLAPIADATDALDRIPRVPEFLEQLYGEPTGFCWDSPNQSDVTTKLLCAGLQLEVEALHARLAEIEQKYEVVRAAERTWRPMFQARTEVVFRNDAGDIAKLPADVARIIASKGAFDGDVISRATTVQFKNEGGVIAEIPKSLFVSLEKVLDASPWNGRRT